MKDEWMVLKGRDARLSIATYIDGWHHFRAPSSANSSLSPGESNSDTLSGYCFPTVNTGLKTKMGGTPFTLQTGSRAATRFIHLLKTAKGHTQVPSPVFLLNY